MPSPGELPNPGIEPGSPALQADSLPAELPRMSLDVRCAPQMEKPRFGQLQEYEQKT